MNGISFQKMEQEFYPEQVGFRPNTTMFPLKLSFLFMNGGMGDYICWIPAIEWLASQATWIEGTIIIPTYFKELADYWLKSYPKWRYADYKTMHDLPKFNDIPFRGPMDLQRESLNATGAHLLTCGWVYFTNKEKAPEGWDRYPIIEQSHLDTISLPKEADSLNPGKYAVITTGMTTNSRHTPDGAWNDVISHIKSRGLTPVFMGKSEMLTGNNSNVKTKWNDGTDYSTGVDLRDKTNLMQAAAIMSRAAVVIGHDNGLLHLAGCTDVPIVFGYNLASPEHRQPRRAIGKVYNVELKRGELACNFCQSNTNFVIGYNFRECFYKDLKCMDMLFENKAERWKLKINEALGG